jgi:RNA polymerase sigma-70 factor (ECF subfamily)
MPGGRVAEVGRRHRRRTPIHDQGTVRHDDTVAARLTDEALVAAVLAGDHDAFRDLVDREAPTVVRACQRILGDRAEAEDAAQEAFVSAFRALGSWRGEGPLGAWVTRIGVRIAVRQAARRRRVSWLAPSHSQAGAMPGVDEVAIERPAGPSTDPAFVAIRAEHAATVRAAVAGLGEPYRETVALRFFGEHSLAEIAAITGRPLGTVKTHLHRGLARLRDRLADAGADR